MAVVVSIIIPCFNSGAYLPDALDSIKAYRDESRYEVIIVNDGSTDQQTLILLEQLQDAGYTVLHQENKGPAAARNTGIRFAQGEYLLFLDSDNKIRSAYMEKGIEILSGHANVGVVYGNPLFFGDSSEARFTTGEFDILRLLNHNYIDMCSVIRKKVFEQCGFFDEERVIIGHEDWEFWFRVYKAGWKFHYVNETLFEYRVTHNSLVNQAVQPEKLQKMLRYVYSKHLDLLMIHYNALYTEIIYYRHDKKYPFRSFAKFLYLKYFSRKQPQKNPQHG